MNELKILIVEDEAIVALEIQIRMQAMGFSVCGISAFGESAIQLAEKTKPDFVLMDIKLKGEMNGLDAAEIIKKKYSIPSIFFTAISDENTLSLIKQSSNPEYILKPLVESELLAAIQRLLDSPNVVKVN
jgi:DNA-binding NarL/FixJ family response regulator